MVRLAAALGMFLLLSGCVAEDAPTDAIPEPRSVDVSMPQGAEEGQATPELAPLLVDVTGALRDNAAELTVPAGAYRLVRLIYDASVWDEPTPWDGDATVSVGMAFRTNGTGVFMRAFGFDFSFGDRAFQPHLSFSPIEGDGWTGSTTFTSCSGDCGSVPPEHQVAWLVGGLEPTTVRVGVVDGFEDVEALWDRPAVPVRADAQTADAFAGSASRLLVLAQEHKASSGILEAQWSAGPAPGVGVQRTSDYRATADVVEPGVFTASVTALETVGLESWSYSLDAPGLSGSWQGPWVWEPSRYSLLATLSGVVWPPIMSVQGNVGVGPVSFEAHREFTGASDPTGLASFSFEFAQIGHAGVDLDALFGWDVTRPVSPDGSIDCVRTSFGPAVPVCTGDPELRPRDAD